MATKHHTRIFTIMLGLAAFAGGCSSTFPDAVKGADGEPLRVDLLFEIGNNPDLSDEEKTQVFNELGLTDPDIIDFLINS